MRLLVSKTTIQKRQWNGHRAFSSFIQFWPVSAGAWR
jgi:hypothetical protein